MGCMENALNELFPTGWLDPYGEMPLNKDYKVQIDITQVETDDGIKVTAVKTPPHASTTSIQDAIAMALGMGCCETEAPTNSQQSADQGKQEPKKNNDTKDSPDENGRQYGDQEKSDKDESDESKNDKQG